jgi:RNA polymerase sigma factor (sigma-70 family)
MHWATTSWTEVLAARGSATTESRLALEALCRTYWYPLYAFVRSLGLTPDDARDLTQAYFAEFLEKGFLDNCDPSRGRFRVFLMTSIRHFLSKEREKSRAWKRGGRAELLSLDETELEGRYRAEPVDRLTPEQIFERRWALTLLENSLARLRDECVVAAKERQFERLEAFITGERPAITYRAAAMDLGISEAAVKMSVHRLRERFGQILRETMAETVADAQDLDDEVRYLLGVIAPWEP